MENKTIWYVVVGIIIALLVGGGIWWFLQPTKTPVTLTPTPTPGPQGRIIFTVTDAGSAEAVGNIKDVTSMQLTLSNIQLHSNTQGWVTVSSTPKQFDLLQLRASHNLMLDTDTSINADNYNEVRMQIDSLLVTKSGVTSQAALPSNQVQINGNVMVAQNATATVVADFLADKSLHTTAQGELIFIPAINLQTRSNASAQTNSEGIVAINGGTVTANVDMGMDLNGDMQQNFILDTSKGLDITAGIIVQKGSQITGGEIVPITK